MIGADEHRVRVDDGVAGALFETFVATELERQAAWAPEPLTFWHYREGEREVDVIVERPVRRGGGRRGQRREQPVRPRAARGLTHLRDRIGARFAGGVVAYAGERTLPLGDRLWAIPLRALWTR